MSPNVTGLWSWYLWDERRSRLHLACTEVMRKQRAVWESGGAMLGKEKQMDHVGMNTSYYCLVCKLLLAQRMSTGFFCGCC